MERIYWTGPLFGYRPLSVPVDPVMKEPAGMRINRIGTGVETLTVMVCDC